MAALVAAVGVKASDYDTLFYKPNEPASLELNVDLEEFPYLEGKKVTWYIGYPETDGAVAKVLGDEDIAVVDGKSYYVNKNLGESWFDGYPKLRTVQLFYGHEVTPSGLRAAKEYYTKEELDAFILDTVAVCHVLKKLNDADINSLKVNGEKAVEFDIHYGDSALAEIGLKTSVNPLDVQKYALISVDGADTTLLAVSDSNKVEYFPEENVEFQAAIINELGIAVNQRVRTLNVLPDFKVDALKSDVVTGKNLVSVTEEDVMETTVNVVEGDSVSLTVLTNTSESKVDAVYTWNFNGKDLPEGVSVKRNTLEVDSVYADNAGVYNCVIAERGGEQLCTASFTVKLPDPTANESISAESVLKYVDGMVYLSDDAEVLSVYDITGRNVKKLNVKGARNVNIQLPSGVYILNDGKNSIKAVVK